MRTFTLITAACVLCMCSTGRSQGFTGVLGQWIIPATAAAEKNPVASTLDQLVKGRSLYSSQCQRCHGPAGRGDGADGDSQNPTADLTDGSRLSINPDGVVFYKILNG